MIKQGRRFFVYSIKKVASESQNALISHILKMLKLDRKRYSEAAATYFGIGVSKKPSKNYCSVFKELGAPRKTMTLELHLFYNYTKRANFGF